MGARSRAIAEQRFDADKNARRLLDLAVNLAQRKAAGGLKKAYQRYTPGGFIAVSNGPRGAAERYWLARRR